MVKNKTSIQDPHNHITTATDRPKPKEWLPCIGIAFAAFVFNTSEFAPIALLSDIAKGFSVSDAKAGLLITIYAWVVALASLPLILIFARVERRKLMAGLLILFIISHLLSWQSFSYTSLLVSRIMVACTHAIFWSVAAPMWGIGSGALIGGVVSSHAGTQYVGLAGFLISILAISVYLLVVRRHVNGRI